MAYHKRCPFYTKSQLVEWARGYYKLPKVRFQKMTKSQLYFFFYNPEKYGKA